jgi:DNA-binding LytR/AlgR family response regulator
MKKDKIDILIIESDSVVQQQIKQLFHDSNLANLVEIASDSDEALLKIIDLNPQLIFLEYPVKGNTGKGIIKFIQSKLPETTIVLISNSKRYAVEAIHYGIYDYLLLPVRRTELAKILEKVKLKKRTNPISRINEIIEKNQEEFRVRFETSKGFVIVNPNDVLYCQTDEAYAELHFTNKNIELAFLSLARVEEIFAPYNFVRISRSVLVNKNYIRKVFPNENLLILSSNGEEYEVKGSRLQVRALGKIN